MPKGPAEFTQQNTERAFQAATVGMDWMRDAAEQGLNQSQAVVRTFLTLARQAGDGFNQQTSTVHRCSLAMAEEKGVQIREYNIIYNLTNDIRAALEGKLKPREEVVHMGRAVIRETFKISRVGTIAGCYVTQGIIKRSGKVRVIREGIVVYEGDLGSLKRFKDDVKEVREGFECGIGVANFNDLKVGDVIEAYHVEAVARTLAGAGSGR